jgi:hypothetical protein
MWKLLPLAANLRALRIKFQHVYRDGDSNASGAADLVVLHSSIRGFKDGSERARQVTTVAGATSIKGSLPVHKCGWANRSRARNLAGPTENARAYHSLGPGIDEDVRGKFKAGTEFANLTQSELALTGKKHGDGTFRTELRN